MNAERARRLMKESVKRYGLDLSGLTVLTEAATGHFSTTASLAALGGAQRVLLLAADSRFGSAKEALDQTFSLAESVKMREKLDVLESRMDSRLNEVQVITNLGFVRPIDQSLLSKMQEPSVALMWEPWEFRPADLDLNQCRTLHVPVLGTNEGHPDLQLFDYLGFVVMKHLFELEVEVFRSKLVVAGEGPFVERTQAVLESHGTQVTVIPASKEDSLASKRSRQALADADALIILEHCRREKLIGPQGQIAAKELKSLNPSLALVHICGDVDLQDVASSGIVFAPKTFALPGYMSALTNAIGPRPLIDLHAAGLRVGQELARERQAGHHGIEAERRVLRKLSLAAGFEGGPND